MHGELRRYLVIRPPGSTVGHLPVIIDLHGSGSSAEEHAGVTAASSWAMAGAVVVLPQASIPFQLIDGRPEGFAWNVPGSPLPGESSARRGPDDVAFIDAIVSDLIDHHGADPTRLHLRGYSGGARLAAHVIAAATGRFASACFVAGVRFVEPHAGPLPRILAIHGLADTVNSFGGGTDTRWSESVPSAVRRWALAAGCPDASTTSNTDHVVDSTYVDALDNPAVRLLAVKGAEHSWPGTSDQDHIAAFGVATDFDASGAHFAFVRDVEADAASAVPNDRH
ncbi:PHB depolymerase family esterase [Mycolicibacterium sediminis]|uniref:Poly(3-hydroxyalkanoate) depolymerase n=1 Tax=Mycolicibacterium sediminis TaxID=1286180 RepID=A0A7I7QRF3_9MYCO|nr:poly(3-hydroxyalkanoate) depolymerase [Mycolicibacterium sediminis]